MVDTLRARHVSTRSVSPTACRATGVSWARGIGRGGSIVGSLVGGLMLAQGWGLGTVYGLVAIPVSIAAVAILVLGVSGRHPATSVAS